MTTSVKVTSHGKRVEVVTISQYDHTDLNTGVRQQMFSENRTTFGKPQETITRDFTVTDTTSLRVHELREADHGEG